MVLAGAITCLTGGVLCRQCSTFTPPGRGRGGSSANVNTTTCCAPLQQSDCISDGADCSGAGGSSCPSPCTGTLTRHRAWEHTSLSDWGQPLSSAQWHQSYTQWVEHLFHDGQHKGEIRLPLLTLFVIIQESVKCQELITLWHCIISQKNEVLNHTAVKYK